MIITLDPSQMKYSKCRPCCHCSGWCPRSELQFLSYRHERWIPKAEADGVWSGDGHWPAELCGHSWEEGTLAVRVLSVRRSVNNLEYENTMLRYPFLFFHTIFKFISLQVVCSMLKKNYAFIRASQYRFTCIFFFLRLLHVLLFSLYFTF